MPNRIKSWRSWLTAKRVHLILLWTWLALAAPSVTVWKRSIPWLVFVSIYAIVATHWSGYQGAKAEEAASTP